MMRRVVGVVGVVVVSAGVLAGCTAPAVEPSPSPSVSVSPSASASPTPTLSAEERLLAQIPEEAKGDDLLAAVEMAKFFLNLQPGLFKGDDPALVRFLSMDECSFCEAEIARAQEVMATRGIQVGGDYTFSTSPPDSVLDTETDNTTTALVGFNFIEGPIDFVDEDGTVLESLPRGGEWRAALALRFVDGLWRVYGWEVRSN